VALDSGGFSDNPTEEGLRRTRVLLDGMVKLGYRVVNVSERDLALGYDEFRKNVEGTGLKFVSANVVKQGTTERVFPAYEVLEVPVAKGKPLRLGVVGVTRFSPVWQKAGPSGSNLALAPPAEMLKSVLPEVRAKADVVVLLAALNRDDAARIAREVPGIDFVFGAYGGIYDTSFRKDASPPVLYTGNQGRFTGEVRVFLDPSRTVRDVQLYLHHLVARYPENPEMLAWLDARRTQYSLRKETGTH
jgi:2',3'-cyclic-nucleotide 2'-phosphodiesterase (5'-nucleotidase family)